jgi:hypothetical protein
VPNREVAAEPTVVWLTEERTFGYIIGGVGAYFTTIRYPGPNDALYEEEIENSEWVYVEEMTLEDTHEYEHDDE